MQSLVNWQNKEASYGHGDPDDPLITHNPLNTIQSEPGAVSISGSSVGVKKYISWQQGIQATLTALTNGRYNDIIAALKTGGGLGNGHYPGLVTWSGGGYDRI